VTAETASSLGHLPAGEHWSFDGSVTDVFDDMLERSIPDYATMRALTTALAERFWKSDRPWIVDLGCSRGGAIAPLVDSLGARAKYLGLETSAPMLAAARERFDGYIRAGVMDLREHDLRYQRVPAVPASVVLAVLTLVFTPIEYRQRIVSDCYATLGDGGALLLVEKVLGADPLCDEVLTEHYYAFKRASGYSQEEIDRKRLALEGVQVPIAAAWNEALLRSAGFRSVDCYWRTGKFAAWLAVR
jgi:tRNA (cmo5U34)-methyltransferase